MNDELIEQIVSAYIDGESLSAVGKRFGISYGTVYNYVKRHNDGIHLRRRTKPGAKTGKTRKFPEISSSWYDNFIYKERFEFLNSIILKMMKRGTTGIVYDADQYMDFIEFFYYRPKFMSMWNNWVSSGRNKWLRPVLTHRIHKGEGGFDTLPNLCFVTMFEKRCQGSIGFDEWKLLKFVIKSNISDYFS